MKLKERLKSMKQLEIQNGHCNLEDIEFVFNPDLVLNLSRLEQDTLLPKKQQIASKGDTGLYRLRNVGIRDKIEKFFKQPAVYMQPHRNALAEIEKRKGYFKPKVMLGSLRKPTREFTTDL